MTQLVVLAPEFILEPMCASVFKCRLAHALHVCVRKQIPGLASSQHRLLGEFQANDRTCLNTQGAQSLRIGSGGCPVMATLTHACTCAHTHLPKALDRLYPFLPASVTGGPVTYGFVVMLLSSSGLPLFSDHLPR